MIKVEVVDSRQKAVSKAAEIVIEQIKVKPDSVLGLATGETMKPFYKYLVDAYRKKRVSFSEVKSFNLDEYVGLESKDKRSFRFFMERELFSKIDIDRRNINFLDGCAKDFREECVGYENKIIRKSGGLDLQILGIGVNGHIGFNEPGSSLRSRTRKVKLSVNTRKINSKSFSSMNDVPKHALTIGLSTIMKSKKIILLATGKEKANAVFYSIFGRPSSEVPASILQKHGEALFILDKSAARRATKKFK